MANPQGTPIWFELMTSDTDAAARFYGDVIGWTAGGFGGATFTGADYGVFSAPDGEGVAGLMKAPAQMPAPRWFGYIGVDDVDAAAARIEAEGGSIHLPPSTIEGVGRMAMVADPQGAVFYVMRGDSPEDSQAFKPDALGHGVWNELVTSDDKAAIAFYESQFGWKQEGGMPMGEGRMYSFLNQADGNGMIGAVMPRTKPDQPVRWHYYFRVGNIDEAKERIERGGGTVRMGPAEVPGGDWVIDATDPQGATFGVVGRK